MNQSHQKYRTYIRCPYCKKYFKSFLGLKMHSLKVHGINITLKFFLDLINVSKKDLESLYNINK